MARRRRSQGASPFEEARAALEDIEIEIASRYRDQWRLSGTFSLSRLAEVLDACGVAADPMLAPPGDDRGAERLFALRGLGALPPDRETVQAAVAALIGARASSDWRVAYEAVAALGKFRSADGLAALRQAILSVR